MFISFASFPIESQENEARRKRKLFSCLSEEFPRL